MEEVIKFQFHKGTIRTQTQFCSLLVNCYFNSIKVRLERPFSLHSTSFALFQFHKGTIRTNQERLNTSLGREFQFHKGTIRTPRAFDEACCEVLFQFHKGTIRTICQCENCSPLKYFNSIKVRLELADDWLLSYGSLFQFHKGTIRTLDGSEKRLTPAISIP